MHKNSNQNKSITNSQGQHPLFIGPIGGAITKHLVELGEEELQKESYEKKKG